MRKIICLFMAVVTAFCICSCDKEKSVSYYGDSVFSTDYGYVVEIDNRYYFYKDISGEPIDFTVDPLADEADATVLCADNRNVYYLNENYEIICRDMEAFEESMFFKRSDNFGISILGLTDAITDPVEKGELLDLITAMYIDKSGVGYIVCDNKLCILKNGQIEPILDNYILTLKFDGEKVYFVDNKQDFYTCNPNGTELTKLTDEKVYNSFSVSNNAIWYMYRNDNTKIYSCDLNGDNPYVAFDLLTDILSFKVAGDYIYYTDATERNLYCSPITDFSPRKLIDKAVLDYNIIEDTDKLLVTVSQSEVSSETYFVDR